MYRILLATTGIGALFLLLFQHLHQVLSISPAARETWVSVNALRGRPLIVRGDYVGVGSNPFHPPLLSLPDLNLRSVLLT